MLKTKQSLNLKKHLHILDKSLCSLIKFIHGHKKINVVAKIIGYLYFLLLFFGSPLNFDKDKRYYILNNF